MRIEHCILRGAYPSYVSNPIAIKIVFTRFSLSAMAV